MLLEAATKSQGITFILHHFLLIHTCNSKRYRYTLDIYARMNVDMARSTGGIMGERVKIVVFVPRSHADAVRQAMGEAGAGKIGSYSHCSYSVEGTGRYIPLAGANPTIGGVGEYEAVEEERIEAVCERNASENRQRKC